MSTLTFARETIARSAGLQSQLRPASPLMLCDRLIGLAQEADRAGFMKTAEHLVFLAHSVLDEPRHTVGG